MKYLISLILFFLASPGVYADSWMSDKDSQEAARCGEGYDVYRFKSDCEKKERAECYKKPASILTCEADYSAGTWTQSTTKKAALKAARQAKRDAKKAKKDRLKELKGQPDLTPDEVKEAVQLLLKEL